MKPIIDLGRRQVLRGAGGVALSLPILPSLLTKAHAADPVFVRRPRFVCISTDHGGILGTNMYPADSTLTESTALFPGHQIKRGTLQASANGADAALSPVLTAPSTLLTAARVGKMNVLRGLDVPFGIGHNRGLHLGNYAANDGNGSEGQEAQRHPRATIDSVMGWSSSFYSDLSSVRQRIIVLGNKNGLSTTWSSPSTKSGQIVDNAGTWGSGEMFERLFLPRPPADKPTEAKRPPYVDRVLESYKLLRNSNQRLSQNDKQRLDDHMDRLAELQRKLSSVPSMSCAAVPDPKQSSADYLNSLSRMPSMTAYHKLNNDVIAAALICGASRIAVHPVGTPFVETSLDWHQDVAHQDRVPERQAMLVAGLRATFQSVFLDLAAKLDVEEAPGMTYLDNSLIAWSQECGAETHESNGLPVITVGSAGGWFKTGQYCDYRNQASDQFLFAGGGNAEQKAKKFYDYTGLPYNRWLGTILQSMGLPKSEYESGGVGGYGYFTIGGGFKGRYVSGVTESLSEPMPFLKA